MKTIKKYIKLLGYGLQIKTMLILSIVFIALGIVYEMIDLNGTGLIPFSGLYLALAGMYIYQVVITASISTLVQVSSVKKKLQCAVPVIFTTCSLLVTFTVFVIMRLYNAKNKFSKNNPDMDVDFVYVQILVTAVLIAFIFLYFAFSYRFYVISTVVLCIVLIPTLLLFARGDWSFTASFLNFVKNIKANFGNAGVIALAYLILLAGAGLCYLANWAMYRKPLSSIAYRTALRQAQTK